MITIGLVVVVDMPPASKLQAPRKAAAIYRRETGEHGGTYGPTLCAQCDPNKDRIEALAKEAGKELGSDLIRHRNRIKKFNYSGPASDRQFAYYGKYFPFDYFKQNFQGKNSNLRFITQDEINGVIPSDQPGWKDIRENPEVVAMLPEEKTAVQLALQKIQFP